MTILPDIQDEAQRIVAAATEAGLMLRLLGGLAIRIHSPSAAHRSLARAYPDLDFAFADRRGDRAEQFFAGLGYEPNKAFNLYNGDSRLLFYDTANERQIDVFVGGFQMCHRIPLADRLQREPLTLPLAELFLTKMQIVRMNEKDVRDLCALLLDHPFGESDDETINLPVIARLCADDWGLWKTVTISMQKVREFCDAYDLGGEAKLTLVERLAVLKTALDRAPKSLKWKTRAKVGERVQWYELPEEVQRG
jgi:hypothetical protein